MGRQLFTLPAFWRAVDLDRFPEVKAPLVADAYRRFFTATFDNLEACFEGRDHRIGREREDPPLATETASMLLGVAKEWLEEKPLFQAAGRPEPTQIDVHGFRHFSGAQEPSEPEPPSYWQQLADQYAAAVAADWARVLS